ncbi:MAG: PH domain-containing protein [Acidimicrobiales bacterium]|nr:PH domain-containing protein [Acidimicrobiales bacterium]
MAFPRKLLNEGEDIVLDMRPHWWYVAGRSAFLILAVVVAIVLYSVVGGDVSAYVGIALILVALALAVWRYYQWLTKEFVVTTDRVIYRHGVFAKQGIQIPLERVNNVIFRQNVIDRLLGAGSLLIESASEFGQQQFSFIRKPDTVQNVIFREMEQNENRKFDRVRQPSADGVPDQIRKLDELRQGGVITEQEFQEKKAKLLGQI